MYLEILQADYSNSRHCQDLIELLDEYARDPMGGGQPLSAFAKANLAAALAKRPDALSLLAYLDGRAVGLINSFEGFSTFACKPLLNIHDVMVLKDYRGQGISRRMLERLEVIARARGCCKLTLEVLAGNQVARQAYERYGFKGYELDPAMGQALFLEKPLR